MADGTGWAAVATDTAETAFARQGTRVRREKMAEPSGNDRRQTKLHIGNGGQNKMLHSDSGEIAAPGLDTLPICTGQVQTLRRPLDI